MSYVLLGGFGNVLVQLILFMTQLSAPGLKPVFMERYNHCKFIRHATLTLPKDGIVFEPALFQKLLAISRNVHKGLQSAIKTNPFSQLSTLRLCHNLLTMPDPTQHAPLTVLLVVLSNGAVNQIKHVLLHKYPSQLYKVAVQLVLDFGNAPPVLPAPHNSARRGRNQPLGGNHRVRHFTNILVFAGLHSLRAVNLNPSLLNGRSNLLGYIYFFFP